MNSFHTASVDLAIDLPDGTEHDIDLDLEGITSLEEFEAAIREACPGIGDEDGDPVTPEYTITAAEGFASLIWDENGSGWDPNAWDILAAWQEEDESRREAFGLYLENEWSGDTRGVHASFEEAYQGEYDSEEAFAEQFTRDTSDLSGVPDWLEIDWKGTWERSLRHDYSYQDGHVFRDL